MSRIGRAPIPVPAGVEVKIEPELVSVSGPRGALAERIPRDITVSRDDDRLLVTRPTDRGGRGGLRRADAGLPRRWPRRAAIGAAAKSPPSPVPFSP